MDTEIIEPQDEASKEAKKKHAQVDPTVQCLSSRKVCKRKRLKGFDFCHKHILEDKNSPFQQCSFIIKSTDERCLNPAPKAESKKMLVLLHLLFTIYQTSLHIHCNHLVTFVDINVSLKNQISIHISEQMNVRS